MKKIKLSDSWELSQFITMIVIASSIAFVPITIALFGIIFPNGAEKGTISNWLLFFGIDMAIIAVLGFIISNYASAEIISQLSRIGKAINQIIEGEYHERIDTKNGKFFDEIKKIAENTNKLADKAEQDIGEVKRLGRVRSEFLGNVSHELRTPIFAIQGFLETLIDGAIEDEDVRLKFVEKAYSNSVRLNNLLSDLIDISRIESGEMHLTFRNFDYGNLVSELVGGMEARAAKKEISLFFEKDEGRMQVYGDKERLGQVLTNLIDNAIKYNKSEGYVKVSLRESEEGIITEIEDNGIGISQEHLDRIFERFYRVDKVRSREAGGTGLGLAIVKHILEAHKSKINIESKSNVGTSITFALKKV